MEIVEDSEKDQLVEVPVNSDRLMKGHRPSGLRRDCINEQAVRKTGPEVIFGRIYDNLGFKALKESIFRHFVIAGFAYPGKKFKPTEYFYHFHDVILDKSDINLFLEKLNGRLKQETERIVSAGRLTLNRNKTSILLLKVATIRSSNGGGGIRQTGAGGVVKEQRRKFYAALLIDPEGVTGYEIFEGDVLKGKNLIHYIGNISDTRKLVKPIIVARKGLLTDKHLKILKEEGLEYIVGAALKNGHKKIIKEIHEKHPNDEQWITIIKKNDRRLIISYSAKKAEKDERKRKRDIIRLQKQIERGEFSESYKGVRSSNKYMKFDEGVIPRFDYEEFNCNKMKDGLRGCISNSVVSNGDVIAMHRRFLQIGKKFRLSVNDLQVSRDCEDMLRIRKRIEARLCIAFTAHQVYKELERVLQKEKIALSLKRSVELTHHVSQIDLPDEAGQPGSKILNMDPELERLYQTITENRQFCYCR